METKKLYYEDAFLREFTATVVDCQPTQDGYAIVLDETAFYPEGGGQPADHGTINGVTVTDVHEKDGVIVHNSVDKVQNGAKVTGVIDWERRFDHMQQHSGEHIVSGLLCGLYDCDNVGFHMGADTVTIDFNAPLTDEQVHDIECRANARIYADEPVRVTYPTPDALAALTYRSKKELSGAVRIVEFPHADICACCGTHVTSAGQVGLVKILSAQKFRGGIRMELVCGKRALDYLSTVCEQNRVVAQNLSVKPAETAAAVARLQAELSAAKLRLSTLEEQVFAATAARYQNAGNVLLFQEALRPDAVRKLCDTVAASCGGRCAVFSGEDGQFAYAIVENGGDIRELVKSMNTALSGRGGGRDGFAQGSLSATRQQIESFFAGDAGDAKDAAF
ncbi:MAG: alanine--tRNA ligase-related protein [Oscillospiraceae bacterium]